MSNNSSLVPHVLGLVVARGNSKGIPRKNLRPLMGRPLIGWAAQALVAAKLVDRRICCSDSEEIMATARSFGLETPWKRPPHLAEDKSLVFEVILHALDFLEAENEKPYTHVALVQATSPTVLAKDIDSAISKAVKTGADTVISGVEVGQQHPSSMYTIGDNGQIIWVLDAEQRQAQRQDLPTVFMRTGLVYVVSVPTLRRTCSIYGDNVVAITIPAERAVTIDTPLDFKFAELLLKEAYDEKH